MFQSATETYEAKKRLSTLDLYKGMAIFGVVVTHIALLQNGAGGPTGQTSAVVQFMYSGLVMFILVSGYFYKPGRTYAENIRHRVVPLVCIYIIFNILATLVVYVYMLAIGYDLSSYDLGAVIAKALFGKGVWMDTHSLEFFAAVQVLAPYDVTIQTYYLAMLFLGYLIFYAVVDRVIGNWKTAVATILILFAISSAYLGLVHIQLPLYLHYAPMVAGFLLIGALLSKYRFIQFIDSGHRAKKFWMGFAAAVLLSVACLILFPAPTNITTNEIGDYGIFTVFTFAATCISCGMLQLFLSSLLTRVPGWSHLFIYMGYNSLYLFLYHMVVAKMLVAPFVDLGVDQYIPLPTPQAMVVATASIAIILIASHFYRKYKGRSPPLSPRSPAPTSI